MQCVEVADLGDDVIGIRSSTDPDGLTLRVTRADLRAFLSGAKAHEFDDLA